jgi:MFS family permease
LWSFAAFATKFFGYSRVIFICLRTLTGIGQAGFLTFAPAMVGSAAPENRSSLYLGIYFMALYMGSGLGMALGGRFDSWETALNAYLGFGGVMGVMIGMFILWRAKFVCPSFETSGEGETKKRTMMRLVYERKTFWTLAIGYGFFIFFVGAVAFWGPTMLTEMYAEKKETAGTVFGGVCLVTGILGTILGGKLVDIFVNKYENKEMSNDAFRCYLSTRISAILVIAAIPFCFIAPFMKSLYAFIGVIAPGMLLLFTTTAPCNIAILNSVPEAARGQAIGLSVTVSHILGDIPSPFVIGILKSRWTNPAQGDFYTLMISNLAIILCALVWLLGVGVALKEGRRFFQTSNKHADNV